MTKWICWFAWAAAVGAGCKGAGAPTGAVSGDPTASVPAATAAARPKPDTTGSPGAQPDHVPCDPAHPELPCTPDTLPEGPVPPPDTTSPHAPPPGVKPHHVPCDPQHPELPCTPDTPPFEPGMKK